MTTYKFIQCGFNEAEARVNELAKDDWVVMHINMPTKLCYIVMSKYIHDPKDDLWNGADTLPDGDKFIGYTQEEYENEKLF